MVQILCNKYDARALAGRITHSDKEIRNSLKYRETQDRIMDITMSCDRLECIDQLIGIMQSAIRYGTFTKDRDWRYDFLAAYDLCDGM